MKQLGIVFFFLLTSVQCLAGHTAHQRDDSLYRRFIHYVNQKPEYGKRVYRPHPVLHAVPRKIPREKLTRDLPHIDSVFIRGGIDLEIIGDRPRNKIALKQHYENLVVKLCGHSIYISNTNRVDCNLSSRPCIKLYIDELKELVVAGDCRINGYHLNTCCGLHISHCGNGSVCLNGPIHLVRVVNSGHAVICIPCVETPHLQILATKAGTIRLGGTAGLLLVRAFQKAIVDTRFMCSHTAMVQAANCALVTVRTVESLKAFADGQSNIYYYTEPGELIQHNTLSGNVFMMGCY